MKRVQTPVLRQRDRARTTRAQSVIISRFAVPEVDPGQYIVGRFMRKLMEKASGLLLLMMQGARSRSEVGFISAKQRHVCQ